MRSGGDVGRQGIRRRKREQHLQKLHGDLGELPSPDDMGPWGPMGAVDSWGKIARASVSDDPWQRRAGNVFLFAFVGPVLLLLLVALLFAVVD